MAERSTRFAACRRLPPAARWPASSSQPRPASYHELHITSGHRATDTHKSQGMCCAAAAIRTQLARRPPPPLGTLAPPAGPSGCRHTRRPPRACPPARGRPAGMPPRPRPSPLQGAGSRWDLRRRTHFARAGPHNSPHSSLPTPWLFTARGRQSSKKTKTPSASAPSTCMPLWLVVSTAARAASCSDTSTTSSTSSGSGWSWPAGGGGSTPCRRSMAAGRAATTRMEGCTPLSTAATLDARPPPLIGTNTAAGGRAGRV